MAVKVIMSPSSLPCATTFPSTGTTTGENISLPQRLVSSSLEFHTLNGNGSGSGSGSISYNNYQFRNINNSMTPHEQPTTTTTTTTPLATGCCHCETHQRRHVTFASHVQQIIIPSPESIATGLYNNNGDDNLNIPKCCYNNDHFWYPESDLAHFRENARLVCRQMREALVPYNTHNATSSQGHDAAQISGAATQLPQPLPSQQPQHQQRGFDCAMAYNLQTRGFEARMCMERQRRKYLANQVVLRMQESTSSPAMSAAAETAATTSSTTSNVAMASMGRKSKEDRLAALYSRCTKWAARLARREAICDYQRAYLDDEEEEEQKDFSSASSSPLNSNDKTPNHASVSTPTKALTSPGKRTFYHADDDEEEDDDDVFNDRRLRRRVCDRTEGHHNDTTQT